MARLFRPHIPIEVKCRVLLRQLGTFPSVIDMLIADYRKLRNLTYLLKSRMSELADLLGCEISELRLDHDPPLGARPQIAVKKNMRYLPDANDPDYLYYRPHGAQHAGSHDIKTRVRGDHGQFSDLALIKRERRRAKNLKKNPRKKHWPKRQFQKRKSI